MTLADLRKIDRGVAAAYELVAVKGCSFRQAAKRLQIQPSTVGHRLSRARILLAGGPAAVPGRNIDWRKLEARLTAQGRCTCGLLKPCDCGTAGLERAASRPGEGPTLPEPGGWDGGHTRGLGTRRAA